MGEGNSFSLLVCPELGEGGTYPGQVQGSYPPPSRKDGGTLWYLPDGQDRGKGRVYPRYLPPAKVPTPPARSAQGVPQGTTTHLAKVPTPQPGQDGGGLTPRYLPPSQVRKGEGIPQGTYLPPAKDLLHDGWYVFLVL